MNMEKNMGLQVEDILPQRNNKHGEFEENARATWKVLEIWQAERNWTKLASGQRHALYMIAHKAARILAGDPDEPDHWIDIQGYAKCVSDRLAKPVHPYELDAYAAAAIGWNCSPEEARRRISEQAAEGRRVVENGSKSEIDRVLSIAAQSRKDLLGKEEPNVPGTPEDGGHHAAQPDPDAKSDDRQIAVGDRVYVKGVKTGVYTITNLFEGVVTLDRPTPKEVVSYLVEDVYIAREARATPDPKFSLKKG